MILEGTVMTPLVSDTDNTTIEANNAATLNTTTVCPGGVYALRKDTIEFIFNFYLLTIIAFVGVIGNTISYIVMRHEAKESSSTFILKVLSVADNLVIIVTFFYFSMPALYDNTGLALRYKIFHEAFAKNIFGILLWISKTMSVYLTIFVTAERFYAVTWPLKAPAVCTLKNARKGVAAVTIFAIIYNSPKYFYFPLFNYEEVPCMGFLPVGVNLLDVVPKWYFYGYVLGLYLIIIYAIPLSTLSILNILLVSSLRRSKLQRQEMSIAATKQDRITEKVIGIVTAFIILESPAVILNIVTIVFPGSTSLDVYLRLLAFTYVFGAVNSVINFYIYIVLGARFRRRLLMMFGCKMKLERNLSSMRSASIVSHDRTSTNKHKPQQGSNGVSETAENSSGSSNCI